MVNLAFHRKVDLPGTSLLNLLKRVRMEAGVQQRHFLFVLSCFEYSVVFITGKKIFSALTRDLLENLGLLILYNTVVK